MAGEGVNLLGLPRAELEAFVAERLGAKPFRARQLMKWIYRRGAANFSATANEAGSAVVRWDFPGVILPGQGGVVKFKAKVR